MKANRKSLLAALASMAFLANSQANVLIGPTVNPANGHLYYLLTPSTWTAAEAEAITLGGHLATINNAAENAWVFTTFGGSRPLWIGLTDSQVEGTFVWKSGEPFSYSNWSPGEPNDAFGLYPEDYTYIVENSNPHGLVPGQWNDVPDDGQGVGVPLYGVVEVVPEPTAMAVVLLGVGLVWGRFRKRC